jgi:hypothetical protein
VNVTACDLCGQVCDPDYRLSSANEFDPVRDFCSVECVGLWAHQTVEERGHQLPLGASNG